MKRKAFTLIEMAIVLIIVAIVVGSFLNVGMATLEKEKISTTQDDLKAIKTSLIAYAAKHGKLPYPDIDEDGKGDSTADCTTDDCELPYMDLNIKSKDNFGMAYNYDVWDVLVDTNRDSFCSDLKYPYTGNQLPRVQNDAEDNNYSVVATILSKGEDKILTGENIDKDRIYEMTENKYHDSDNNDIVVELSAYELLGSVCDLVCSGEPLGISSSLFNVVGRNASWTQQTVDLSIYAGHKVRLVWKWTVGDGTHYIHDFQLDDIAVDTYSYGFETSVESFETTAGDTSAYTSASWQGVITSTTNNNGIWRRHDNNTPSANTGNLGANGGSFFVYTETSGSSTNNFQIWLRSPEIDLSATTTNLTFFEGREIISDTGSRLDFYIDVIEQP